jgi:hypothetical protein
LIIDISVRIPFEHHFLGDVICLSIFGQPIIILNSAKAALHLLEKWSSIYSDRPYMAMVGDLVGWKNALGGLRYGEDLRHMRKFINKVFNPRSAQAFWSLEEQETARFANRLRETPEHFLDHIRQ